MALKGASGFESLKCVIENGFKLPFKFNFIWPLLHFGAASLGKRDTFTTPNMYHDPSVGDNVWDYFFEQPVNSDVNDVNNVDDVNNVKNVDNDATSCPDPATAPAVQLDNDSLLMLHEEERGSVFAYPHGWFCLRIIHSFIRYSFVIHSLFIRFTGTV